MSVVSKDILVVLEEHCCSCPDSLQCQRGVSGQEQCYLDSPDSSYGFREVITAGIAYTVTMQ